MNKKETYIWLSSLGIMSKTISRMEEELGEIEYIWNLSNNDILTMKSIRKPMKERLIANRNEDYISKTIKLLNNKNVNVITIDDEKYPERLLTIYDPPKILYYKGKDVLDNPSIAIVGSRKMTSYGKWATEKISKELSEIGVTIVSGIALGIDSVAHRVCIDNKGTTIGVIGNGLDQLYPARNKDLYKEIEENGAVVSEYFYGTPPLHYNFPHRNRIISGLSLGVLVIEAKGKSGSLITGHHAMDQGKEVFALPGPINSIFSEGTNLLIQDGAKLVLKTDDIIDEVKELEELREANDIRKSTENIDLSDLELHILKKIKDKPISIDQLVLETRETVSTVSAVLTVLEIKGLVKEIAGRMFTLS